MVYSSSLRFLEIRSPPVAAARSAKASEALDCSVPVFGNSFAPAFLADWLAADSLVASLTAFSLAITATEPSAKVTTTDPSLLTLISVAVGLAFLTSSATLAFYASVKLAGSLTGVLAFGSLTPFESASLTVFAGVKTATEPSGKVTVAVPSFPTSTLLAVGLAFLTSSATLAFSASVRADGFTTGVIAGSLVATIGSLASDV
mgnify:CR=1 FL=1